MNELEIVLLTRFAEFYKNNDVDIDNLLILQNDIIALLKYAYSLGFENCRVLYEVINDDSVCSL